MEGLRRATKARLFSTSTSNARSAGSPTLSALLIHYPKGRQPSCLRPRNYATSNSVGGAKTSSRKQVTIRNDDGRVRWGDLTVGEKAARTTQQTFNFGIILLGLSMTVRSRFNNVSPLLRLSRLALPIYCTLKSSRQTARPGISIVLLTGSEPILGHWICLDQVRPFEPSENPQRVNGQETGRLRERVRVLVLVKLHTK